MRKTAIALVQHKLTKRHAVLAGAAVCLVMAAVLVSALRASAQTAPAAPPAGGTLEQRLGQRKAERKIALDDRSQKRIVGTCVGAQGKIRALQQKTTPALDYRAKMHQQMDAKLWVVIGKLKIAEEDTFKLEGQRAALAEKTAGFQTTAQLYQQTLNDLLVVNCQADPTGFKALLDTARLYRTSLREQATGIRNYVVNDVKLSLSAFATELQAKASTEGS